LAELTEGVHRYPQILVNVRVREKRPFEELPSVQRQAQAITQELGDHGRLLLRYSGTEPLARIMIEGQDEREIKSYANDLADLIRQELDAVDS
jgi:phosphoglucosamine mutase